MFMIQFIFLFLAFVMLMSNLGPVDAKCNQELAWRALFLATCLVNLVLFILIFFSLMGKLKPKPFVISLITTLLVLVSLNLAQAGCTLDVLRIMQILAASLIAVTAGLLWRNIK